jgi:hypothetical protein
MVVLDHPSQAHVEQEVSPAEGKAHGSQYPIWLCCTVLRGSELNHAYIIIN